MAGTFFFFGRRESPALSYMQKVYTKVKEGGLGKCQKHLEKELTFGRYLYMIAMDSI